MAVKVLDNSTIRVAAGNDRGLVANCLANPSAKVVSKKYGVMYKIAPAKLTRVKRGRSGTPAIGLLYKRKRPRRGQGFFLKKKEIAYISSMKANPKLLLLFKVGSVSEVYIEASRADLGRVLDFALDLHAAIQRTANVSRPVVIGPVSGRDWEFVEKNFPTHIRVSPLRFSAYVAGHDNG